MSLNLAFSKSSARSIRFDLTAPLNTAEHTQRKKADHPGPFYAEKFSSPVARTDLTTGFLPRCPRGQQSTHTPYMCRPIHLSHQIMCWLLDLHVVSRLDRFFQDKKKNAKRAVYSAVLKTLSPQRPSAADS